METSPLLLSVFFSSVGLGYFIYGKKQKVLVPFLCGLILIIFPYFIENTWLIVLIGGVFMGIPYFISL